jgi:hypothetical protein
MHGRYDTQRPCAGLPQASRPLDIGYVMDLTETSWSVLVSHLLCLHYVFVVWLYVHFMPGIEWDGCGCSAWKTPGFSFIERSSGHIPIYACILERVD